ncbi:MAG: hypothetical protein KGI27_02215 [Thaumarchaeota archaeon]|nr:hypothetical protein [Nitrososphaerota archaeon]
MRTKKVKLPDEAIEFLSDAIEEKKMSVHDAVAAWNRKQEVRKFLKVGDVVKIYREDASDYNGKKAFIGAILHECGTGFDPDKSGKFSVYLLGSADGLIQGDLLGYELEPTGKSITREFVTEYIRNPNLRDSMREELKKAIEEI